MGRFYLILRWGVIVWGWFESQSTRLFPKQWVLRGGCQKTGACCRLIALEMPAISSEGRCFRWIKRFGIWWNEKVNGFDYAGMLEGRWLGFTCKRLASDNTCSDYGNRPRVCRQYPWVTYFGRPRLAKGCGFRLSLRPQRTKLMKEGQV